MCSRFVVFHTRNVKRAFVITMDMCVQNVLVQMYMDGFMFVDVNRGISWKAHVWWWWWSGGIPNRIHNEENRKRLYVKRQSTRNDDNDNKILVHFTPNANGKHRKRATKPKWRRWRKKRRKKRKEKKRNNENKRLENRNICRNLYFLAMCSMHHAQPMLVRLCYRKSEFLSDIPCCFSMLLAYLIYFVVAFTAIIYQMHSDPFQPDTHRCVYEKMGFFAHKLNY